MTQVVGVRWRTADPLSYADAGDLEMHRNSYVVLETEKAQEFGWVVKEPRALVMSQPDDELLLTVLRKATASDFGRWQQIKEMEGDAFRLARTKVRECQLTMKIVEAHYTFDQSRIIVTFGAEGRVDFRPLLRELGTALRCRVELKQVGDRDVAKLAGGIGRCGRVLCCASWMTKFDSETSSCCVICRPRISWSRATVSTLKAIDRLDRSVLGWPFISPWPVIRCSS